MDTRTIWPTAGTVGFLFPLYHACQMLRFDHFVIFVGIALFSMHGQTERPKQYMRITALQYREKNTKAPYQVEGKASPTVLYYHLICKNAASNLHVNQTYEIEETVNENSVKTLLILLPDADKPAVEKPRPDATLIGVTCTVESATIREGK
jgi:hypothetical protein